MTQIEQIKAEIERLLNSFPKPHGEVLPIDQNAYNLLGDLKLFIESLPVEQPSGDLEKEIDRVVKEVVTPEVIRDYAQGFKAGAQWQKEQSTKLLKTIYSDCDNLKKDLDRVTTGNLPHRIGNIKFSITGIQVIIKQAMEDEQ